jgi:hypothetical protein
MSASIRRNDGSWSIRYTFLDDLIASDLMVVWGVAEQWWPVSVVMMILYGPVWKEAHRLRRRQRRGRRGEVLQPGDPINSIGS